MPPRRKKPNVDNFSPFIYKVLKQVHSELGISVKSMRIVNDFVCGVRNRLLREAVSVCELSQARTLDATSIVAAVRLVLPGELAMHSVSESTKAVAKASLAREQTSAGDAKEDFDDETNDDGDGEDEDKEHETGASATSATTRRPRMTASAAAGLVFPVAQVVRFLKARSGLRLSGDVGIALTAVLEYLCAEVLELTGNQSRLSHMLRISPRHILLALRGDEELDTLIGRDAIVASGGVIPKIHGALLPQLLAKPAEPSDTAADVSD